MNRRQYITPSLKVIETHLENAILTVSLGFNEEERDVWSVGGHDDFEVDEDYEEDY